MRIAFIQPAVGRLGRTGDYPRTWIMEPLAIAVLSALTPREIDRVFIDDRLEEIDYDAAVDLVAMPVECYTAARTYEIARRFRARGVPVALGGFHATLCPDEAAEHADVVLLGDAETTWPGMLDDFAKGKPARRYVGTGGVICPMPDRTIFAGRPYGLLNLVETARGCSFDCEFCSITRFFRRRYTPRPVDDVIAELETLPKRFVFFVDDNLAMDVPRLKELCRRMLPLKKRWLAQLSIHTAKDEELLTLMERSGCAGVLIGFESLNGDVLEAMGKRVNLANADYERGIENLRRHHLSIYATFVFGYDQDTEETFQRTFAFARKNRFFFAAFNHLVPFPGTAVYERLLREGRLTNEKWWLDRTVSFGDVVFRPKNFTPGRLAALCQEHRLKYYSTASILQRGCDFRANAHGLLKALCFFYANFQQRHDIVRRRQLKMGAEA